MAPRRYRWTVRPLCLSLSLVSGVARAGFPPPKKSLPSRVDIDIDMTQATLRGGGSGRGSNSPFQTTGQTCQSLIDQRSGGFWLSSTNPNSE